MEELLICLLLSLLKHIMQEDKCQKNPEVDQVSSASRLLYFYLSEDKPKSIELSKFLLFLN